MVFLVAIRIEKRAIWRLGGLTALWQDPPVIMGPRPPFPRTHHPGPNLGLGRVKFGPFSLSYRVSANGGVNAVFLAAIRIGKRVYGSAVISAWPPRNQWVPIRHFPGAAIQTLISAMDG